MPQEVRLIAIIDIKSGVWDHIASVVMDCVHKSRNEDGNRFYRTMDQ